MGEQFAGHQTTPHCHCGLISFERKVEQNGRLPKAAFFYKNLCPICCVFFTKGITAGIANLFAVFIQPGKVFAQPSNCSAFERGWG